ncbi:hypothetical protein B0T19DRAFT_399482 [Cercophora scortea]|uniref:Uncharacterized protein n=1 Tax=Cercophora scortea TaxID=314031 RepID=A0AAE0IZ00_9PEZI|nr:hypothetical protein B0T19DRAFT_399482 [Cercophora scortea]
MGIERWLRRQQYGMGMAMVSMEHNMSVRSGSSAGWTDSASRSSGGSTRYREHRIPNTAACNMLLYLCGRDPRRARGVRVYETTFEDKDQFETRSGRSGRTSGSSRRYGGRNKSTEIFTLEYGLNRYNPTDSLDRIEFAARKSRPSDLVSPSSKRSKAGGDPWIKNGGGAKRPAAHVSDDSEDDDDFSSDGGSSTDDFDPRGPFPMPPPPGAFQPGYGPIPHGHPGPQFRHPQGPPMHQQPQPQGFRTPMPPNMPRPMPPPPAPAGGGGGGGGNEGFVRDSNGVQFFTG